MTVTSEDSDGARACGDGKYSVRATGGSRPAYSKREIRFYLDRYQHLVEAVELGCSLEIDSRDRWSRIRSEALYRGLEANKLLIAKADISRAMENLPDRLRRQVDLWTSGYTQWEAARRLGMSQPAVSRVRQRVVNKMYRFLNGPARRVRTSGSS